MAVQMFMKVDGVIGGSTNFHYRGWADVMSWNWAVNRGIADGKAVTRLNEITVVKAAGIESPALMKLCATGTRAATAEIAVVPVVGKREAQQKYIAIVMENVLIQSVATGGSTEEAFIREKLGVRFGAIRYEFYSPEKVSAEGAASGADCTSFGWNVAARAPAP